MIELIPVNVSYADVLMKWRRQPSTLKHNPVRDITSEEFLGNIQSKSTDLAQLDNKSSFLWVGLTKIGEPFGHIGLNHINILMWTAEIGYVVGEQFQGKGLGTQMVRIAVETIFAGTPLRKLYAHVHDKNIVSCKLLERVGFKKEGLLREHYLINGSPENEVFYGVLRSEIII